MSRAEPSGPPLRTILQIAPSEAGDAEADAVLYDLRTAAPATTHQAAEQMRGRLDDRWPLVLLRVAAPDEGGAAALAELCGSRPHAIVTSGAEAGADLQHLGAILAVEEAKAGLEDGAIGILAIAETAGALFGLIGFAAATPRLVAIGWDGEALGRDLGGEEPREADGRWSDPLQTARTLTLAAAADAGLPAIDGPFSTRDLDAFRREAERAKRDGFAGKIALDARQGAIVREAFGQP